MKSIFRILFFLNLFLWQVQFFVSAQSLPVPRRNLENQHIDSDSLYTYFDEKGLNPVRLVNSSLSEEFPYNILIHFRPDIPLTEKTTYPSLVIAVSQEDIPFFLTELTNFAVKLKQKAPRQNLTIVCTAGDVSAISKNTDFSYPEGTHTFVSTLDATSPVSIIILQPNKEKRTNNTNTITVIPGIPFKVAPMQLLKQLFRATDISNISIKVMGSFFSFYRIGFIHRDQTLGEYLDADIPAVLLECKTAHIFSLFEPFMNEMTAEPAGEWDFHYSLFSYMGKNLFIPEQLLLILLLLFSFVPLMYFIIFSFFDRTARIGHLQDLKKSWFLVPLLAIITWLLLYAGQHITLYIYPKWRIMPFYALILKGMIAIFLLSIVSVVHRWIIFPTREYIYSWLLNLIAFADVFIFATFDLSLIVPFCIQLLLALATTKIKKTLPLIIIGLLMLLPFLPFLSALFTIPRQNIPTRFFSASLLENFFIACFILPAEFMWIRILVKLNIFGRNGKIKFPYMITAMAVLSAVIAGSIIGISVARERLFPQQQAIQHDESISDCIHTDYLVSNFMNHSRIDVLFSSDAVPLKYDIKVKTGNGFAVFDANFPFETSDLNKTATFILNEFPPNPMKLKYTCEKNTKSMVELTAFLRRSDGVIITETKTISIFTAEEESNESVSAR